MTVFTRRHLHTPSRLALSRSVWLSSSPARIAVPQYVSLCHTGSHCRSVSPCLTLALSHCAALTRCVVLQAIDSSMSNTDLAVSPTSVATELVVSSFFAEASSRMATFQSPGSGRAETDLASLTGVLTVCVPLFSVLVPLMSVSLLPLTLSALCLLLR